MHANIMKGVKRNLFTDSQNILYRRKKQCSKLFNIHGVSNVRQTEIHAVEALVPKQRAFEFEIAILKLKRQK